MSTNVLERIIEQHAGNCIICLDGEDCDFCLEARLELDALRSDLATARQAMLDYIGFQNAIPGCGCPICKWMAAHPQKGETE